MWKRRVERSSLENVQRRGKLNLFGRLSGMDSSKSSRSRLMRFSAITPAKSNEFFFSFFWLESPGGKFFVPFNILYFFNTFYDTRMLQFFRDIFLLLYVYKYYNYYVLNKIYNLFDSTASSKE